MSVTVVVATHSAYPTRSTPRTRCRRPRARSTLSRAWRGRTTLCWRSARSPIGAAFKALVNLQGDSLFDKIKGCNRDVRIFFFASEFEALACAKNRVIRRFIT